MKGSRCWSFRVLISISYECPLLRSDQTVVVFDLLTGQESVAECGCSQWSIAPILRFERDVSSFYPLHNYLVRYRGSVSNKFLKNDELICSCYTAIWCFSDNGRTFPSKLHDHYEPSLTVFVPYHPLRLSQTTGNWCMKSILGQDLGLIVPADMNTCCHKHILARCEFCSSYGIER